MPVYDLTLWRYYLQEPRGDERDDYRTASIVQSIYGIAAGFGSGKPPKLSECLLKFDSVDNSEEKKRLNIAKAMMALQALSPKNCNIAGKIKHVLGLETVKTDTKTINNNKAKQ